MNRMEPPPVQLGSPESERPCLPNSKDLRDDPAGARGGRAGSPAKGLLKGPHTPMLSTSLMLCSAGLGRLRLGRTSVPSEMNRGASSGRKLRNSLSQMTSP